MRLQSCFRCRRKYASSRIQLIRILDHCTSFPTTCLDRIFIRLIAFGLVILHRYFWHSIEIIGTIGTAWDTNKKRRSTCFWRRNNDIVQNCEATFSNASFKLCKYTYKMFQDFSLKRYEYILRIKITDFIN